MKITKKDIPNITDTIEAMKVADLNFTVAPVPLITANGIDVIKHKAIVREDNNTVLGIVGNVYHPVQNTDAFALGDVLCQEYGAEYEYGYSVDGGRRSMLQAKLPQSFEIGEGDKINEYLTIVNSHDGSTPLTILITPIRLWCDNQLNAAIKTATNCVKIRHTVTALNRAKIAMQVFSEAQDYFEKFEIVAKRMAMAQMDAKMVEDFLNGLVGEEEAGKKSTRKKNIKEEITSLYNTGIGNEGKTIWDMYNGVTEYIDHHRGNDDEKRMASALVGSGVTTKEKAWSLLTKTMI